ncbi:MAG: SpoIID/LytB domain-containing protein [Acidobacteriia bacterium]|nr:SpoIID/LytB domain-containing protein [Terriglobia bacterium]
MIRAGALALALLLGVPAWAQTVRIGVFGLFHPTELSIAPAPGSSLVIETDGESGTMNQAVQVRLAGDRVQLLSQGVSWRVTRVRIHARDGGLADLVLSVAGKIRRRYRGALEIVSNRSELAPIVTMDLELAVASAVAAESPPGAPLEALKAQAVATRSFLVAHGSGHKLFDFCDTTHCQFLRQPPAPHSLAARAARETRGMVLTYLGSPFSAMFASSCGGRSKTLAELGLPVRDYPYFAVDCPYCRRNADRWTRKVSRRVVGERGRLELDRQRGWSALPGNHYSVKETDDGIVMKGAGQGHGLGLCQKGAAGMAAEGKSFREILDHYYPNTLVQVDAALR